MKHLHSFEIMRGHEAIAQDALSKGQRVLILVHRDFLIEQSLSTLCSLGVVREHIGVIKAGYRENHERPLQLASIQTLIRRRDALPRGIDLVIVDECHSVAFHREYDRYLRQKAATSTQFEEGLETFCSEDFWA